MACRERFAAWTTGLSQSGQERTGPALTLGEVESTRRCPGYAKDGSATRKPKVRTTILEADECLVTC